MNQDPSLLEGVIVIVERTSLVGHPQSEASPLLSHHLSCHLILSPLLSSLLISSHLISSTLFLVSSHRISSHLLFFHLISSKLISFPVISFPVISSHRIASHLISSYLILSDQRAHDVPRSEHRVLAIPQEIVQMTDSRMPTVHDNKHSFDRNSGKEQRFTRGARI